MAQGEKIMEKKITKRTNIETLLTMNEVLANADCVAYLKNELALLDKKNERRKGELTETQKENLGYKDDVIAYLETQTEMKSNSQIAKYLGISTQRLTNILKTLVAEGKLTVETQKRTNYYKVA